MKIDGIDALAQFKAPQSSGMENPIARSSASGLSVIVEWGSEIACTDNGEGGFAVSVEGQPLLDEHGRPVTLARGESFAIRTENPPTETTVTVDDKGELVVANNSDTVTLAASGEEVEIDSNGSLSEAGGEQHGLGSWTEGTSPIEPSPIRVRHNTSAPSPV